MGTDQKFSKFGVRLGRGGLRAAANDMTPRNATLHSRSSHPLALPAFSRSKFPLGERIPEE